ncbi:hypothetical protein [Erwinia tasmaniensis]|uniref:Uncharacterized protein n=1 Tax=Erwinia tasmaniensis (strain DSM 17950 / CFBP 7177 / CIP 109463 / NCPPB 4357 / Et1/99) TaxID=465817 RepID=B2VKK8_ERWT9|nr:hypothetical protein [Erwinia tasmaniensis]CAO96738.1 hypothetical protein ETA_16920 [Erwinia tasmaniensis Et1/99]
MQGIILTRYSQYASQVARQVEIASDSESDIWFDARELVEIQQEWFDAEDQWPPVSCDNTEAYQTPLSEDFYRCFSQLSRILADAKQTEILSVGLGKLLPGLPINILSAAQSIYIAAVERKDIDIAVLQALGLASACLPDNINIISHLASFIRHTIAGYAEPWEADPLSVEDSSSLAGTLYTMLALSAVVARHWVNDADLPQRGLLRVPGFMANLLVRTRVYWTALDNLARSLCTTGWKPGFTIDTQIEVTHIPAKAGNGTNRFISAFSANSTANPEFYTGVTIDNLRQVALPPGNRPAASAHAAAVTWLKRASGISVLQNCHTVEKQISQRKNGLAVVTRTHFNTRCDATRTRT